MLQAHILNRASTPRRGWTTLRLPLGIARDFGNEITLRADRGRQFRAVHARNTGEVATYYADVLLDGDEQMGVEIVNEMPAMFGTAFTPHPWISNNHLELIPKLLVRTTANGPVLTSGEPKKIQLASHSLAHQRWRVETGIPDVGVWATFWIDVYAMDPVARIYSLGAWSDRNDPEHLKQFDSIAMLTGERVQLDWSIREGYPTPFYVEGQGWVQPILSNVELGEGEGWMLNGSMLGLPARTDDPRRWGPTEHESLQHLMAALEGGRILCAADATVWDRHWTAARNVPQQTVNAHVQALGELRRYQDMMQQPAGYRGRRLLGNGPVPNQTGDQRDFGSTAGTHVMAGGAMVEMLDAYKHAASAEALRGILHFEADGSPLSIAQHPDWTTNQGRTHWSETVSPDRLGKRSVPWPIFAGWTGYDDQHKSQNHYAADLFLDDDPASFEMLQHQLVADLTDAKHKFNGRSGARAEGRKIGTFAHFMTVTDGADRAAWLDLIGRIAISQASNPTMNTLGPMKVLRTNRPDGRTPIRDDNDNLLESVSIWEHALAAIGIQNGWNVLVDTDEPGLSELTEVQTKCCELLARYGCFQEDGRWYIVDNTAWLGGDDVGELTLNNPLIITGRSRGGVSDWGLYGVAVAAHFLPPGELQAKAQACVEALLPEAVEGIRDAEWRATFLPNR